MSIAAVGLSFNGPDRCKATRSAREMNKTLEPIKENSSSAVDAMKERTALRAVPARCEAAQNEHCKATRCTVCARLPYQARGTVNSLLFHSMEMLDMDFGMFELVRKINEEDFDKVDREVANETAETANRHVKYFRRKLSRVGLLNGVDQNYSGECCCARVVAVRSFGWSCEAMLLLIYCRSQPIICTR